MTDAQRKYIREYYREYRKRHRATINARQGLYNRRKSNPERAERIEEAKAYYRAEFPSIDGIIMDDNKTRLEIYYSRDGVRFVTEMYFDAPEDCAAHHTALCDLMKEEGWRTWSESQ